MIKVRFFIKGENLSGFKISGHAGFANAGKDIVCAAVSSAAYMAANTVTEIIKAEAKASDCAGTMILEIASPTAETELVLQGLKLHLSELAKEYPRNITLNTEV